MIEVRNLVKTYTQDSVDTQALKNISFSIAKGEYVAITGPSGGGKSTLLSIIGLLDNPTSGEFIFSDTDITTLSVTNKSKFRNTHLGFIFQSFHLLAELNVFDNVALPLLYCNKDKQEIEHLVNNILKRLNIQNLRDKKSTQLSGGQQQRVAIARALVNSPSLLLVDEPTGNLDSENGEMVMNLLDDCHQQGATIILVTHDLAFAKRAQRQLFLYDGSIKNI